MVDFVEVQVWNAFNDSGNVVVNDDENEIDFRNFKQAYQHNEQNKEFTVRNESSSFIKIKVVGLQQVS